MMTMEEILIKKGFVPTEGNENFSHRWEKKQWIVIFDNGSQADLYIKNYKDDEYHVHGIVSVECKEYPELGLNAVLEKYGI